MTYISETMSDEDKARIGFAQLVAHNWKLRPDSSHRWVIDRETGNWLFRDNRGGEDDFMNESFTFYWNGNVVRLHGVWKSINRDGKLISGYQLTSRPNILAPENREAEFYAQLLVAMTAHSRFTNPTTTVEIFNSLEAK